MPAESSAWSSAWIVFYVSAFFLGAIPFGRLIARSVGRIDITKKGSGNIGATNVARELGMKWGVLTLLLDFVKGFIPALCFLLLFPEAKIGLSIIGLCSLLGHQFTPFLRFRGGKGVATTLGFFFAVSPLSTIPAIGVFLLTVYLSDFISLGSIVAAFSLSLFLALFGDSGALLAASLVAAVLICFQHRENIRRLLSGEERRWRRPANKEVSSEP